LKQKFRFPGKPIRYRNSTKALLFPEGESSALFAFARKEEIMKRNHVKQLVLASMFLALALALPFLTGQIPQIGSMLCPMHIPVLLCGFFCGWPWGAAVGAVAPLLRSLIFGMPPMFPTALCMAFELATYGAVSGYLYEKLPKKKSSVFVSLISAMIVGRLVWGAARFLCAGLDPSAFGLGAFWAGAVTSAVPGIIVQLVLIPILVLALDRNKKAVAA